MSDGLQDFSAQLQADTSEVSRETRETVEQANVQLAHKLERVTEQLDAAQLGQSISTLGATVSEQAGRATLNPNPNPNPSPNLNTCVGLAVGRRDQPHGHEARGAARHQRAVH